MQFLEKYVEAMNITCQPSSKIIIVDYESTFLFVSNRLATESKINSNLLIGKTYTYLPPVSNIANNCTSEDVQCLSQKKPLNFLTLQTYADRKQLCFKQKHPIVSTTGDAIGVRVDFNQISMFHRFRLLLDEHIFRFNQNNLKINDTSIASIVLTEIEELVLFLLLVYNKPKHITAQINGIMKKNISVSTVRNIIHSQLLRKFEVLCVEDLIDKAVYMNFDSIVPRLLNNQFSIPIMNSDAFS